MPLDSRQRSHCALQLVDRKKVFSGSCSGVDGVPIAGEGMHMGSFAVEGPGGFDWACVS
jgi:hypothetical protein